MSTRSIILITGKNKYDHHQTIRLYKHMDGYPTGNLEVINAALERGIRLVNDENSRFDSKSELSASTLAGLIIGEATTIHGMGAYVEDTFDETFKPKHLGVQWDLEWVYVIDTFERTVRIYGGGYSGKPPQEAYEKGIVDPMKYAKQLREECQDNERKETKNLITSIEAWGFKVNPKKLKLIAKKGKK